MSACRHLLLLTLLLSPPDMCCFGDGLVALQLTPKRPAGFGVASAASSSTDGPPSRRLRSSSPARVARAAAPALLAASKAAGDGPKRSKFTSWLIANRSMLLLICLIVHKCSTDGLTRYTRVAGAYSGNTVAVLSEIVKFPLIACAIASFGGGPSQILPIFKDSIFKTPFSNAWIALCYTFNNLLYFDALSALSATAYQVLSQSKTLFTAGLMYVIVGKRLIRRQIVAIGLLIGGALLVQYQELTRASSMGAAGATTNAIMWGAFLTIFSSFISALPNVAYERVLKTEGENQWVNNIQVTVWIMLWIHLSGYVRPTIGAIGGLFGVGGAAAPSLSIASPSDMIALITSLPTTIASAFDGFTPAVWGVVLLKALNGILIPATFKYADNILYAYAKPSSIVVTTILSCALAGTMPSLSLTLGVFAVVASIFLYSSKPKPKTA